MVSLKMIETKNSYFKQYLSFLFLFKFLTVLHLIWTYYNYNDVGNSFKHIKNEHNAVGTFDFIFHRSLTEHEFQERYDYTNMNDKVLDEGDNNNEEYGIYYVSPYEQLSKRTSNHMGVLQRNYKNRFGKKRGLAKVDHYFEKKLFDKFDNIYEISKKIKNDKKMLKKGIYKKYGIRFTVLYLSSFLGLIIPILHACKIFHISSSLCPEGESDTHEKCDLIFNKIFYANVIVLSIFYIIFISIFIYGLIKIIKYERIKAIKGKMSLKEYCNFCKEVIRKT